MPQKRSRPKASSRPLKWGDLKVRVRARSKPDEVALTQKSLFLLHRCAAVRQRAFGESIGANDDVELSLVGFVDGKVLPFSVRASLEQRLWLGDEAVPGLRLLLQEMTVGGRLEFETLLPKDYPQEKARGKRAVFVLEVLDAAEIQEPSVEDPDLLDSAGCGSAKEFFQQAAEEVAADADTLEFHDTLHAVLDALRERANLTIGLERIAGTVGAWWWEREGSVLEALKFPKQDVAYSENAWLSDLELRAEAERRLANTAVLDIIAAQEGIGPGTPDPHAAARLARFSGIPVLRANALLQGTANPMQDLSGYLRVIEHVLERVKIEVVPAEP